MAQTEEFMFQNVAYRPTVYVTGTLAIELGLCLDDFVLPNVKWSSTFFPPDSA